MSAILLSCIGHSSGMDSYFSNLLDILPPECYFDAESLSQLKSAINEMPAGSSKNLLSPAKLLEASTVTRCAQLLEKSEAYSKAQAALSECSRAKLKSRINQLQSQRKSNNPESKKNRSGEKASRKAATKPNKNKSGKFKGDLKKNPEESKNSASLPTQPKEGSGMPLFSRFNFMNDADAAGGRQKDGKRKLNNKRLLAIAEKREAKIEALRQEDSVSARQVESKEAWQRALDKARGVKVKDDPKYLRKAIRKEHSLKRRSARKWAERDKQEATKAGERQEKRNRNIEKAKAMRAKNKLSRHIAKGHILPGF